MSANLHQKIVNRSFKLLHLNNNDFRHFSFIVRKNKIVSEGINHERKTHPLASKYSPEWGRIHSEMDALIKSDIAPAELRYYDLYNVRIGKSGRVLLSRPCSNCQRVITDFGFRNVFYTNEFGLFEEFLWKI